MLWWKDLHRIRTTHAVAGCIPTTTRSSLIFPLVSFINKNGRYQLRTFRQHVNPLSLRFREPTKPPEWARVYTNPTNPFHVDIGCASGEMICELARSNPNVNYLGVDVRHKVIQAALRNLSHVPTKNIHFLQANLQYSADTILGTMPGPINTVTILHPDPWFKKRHKKRRLVSAAFLELLRKYLHQDTHVHVQTDVQELYEDMCQEIEGLASYTRLKNPQENLLGIQ